MRARLAIKYSGADVELREIVLRNKPPELLSVSPKATVPVLQIADGEILEQSIDIMRWALALNDPDGWIRAEENEVTQSLIDINDGPFKQLLDRYKYAPRFPERPAQAYRDEAVELLLSPMNERLARGKFLLRDTPSMADMALFPFVRQFAGVDSAWFAASNLKPLKAWMDNIADSPLFEAVMPKFEPWKPGDLPVMF